MISPARTPAARWAIVVGDDHGPDSGLSDAIRRPGAPAQYCPFNGKRTLFRDGLQRAIRVAPASQVMVTALDAYRAYWEPALWFIRPQHRFVSTEAGMSWLTTASAILSVARKAPDSVVTLLPGRCFVSQEGVLSEAIDRAVSLLPRVPEAVITLGMQDLDDGIDEDYLVPTQGEKAFLQPLLGVARRPVPWIAEYLRAEGALVASRIICGYARTLASHISMVWPASAGRLLEHILESTYHHGEDGVRIQLPGGVPKAMLRSRQWYPPALPQRAMRVRACGWSGLRTARAVARLSEFLLPPLLPHPLLLPPTHSSRGSEEALDHRLSP